MRNLSATERPSFTNLEELQCSKGLVADNVQKCIHNVISPNNSTDLKDIWVYDGFGNNNKKKNIKIAIPTYNDLNSHLL